jgi:hypothetical protein
MKTGGAKVKKIFIGCLTGLITLFSVQFVIGEEIGSNTNIYKGPNPIFVLIEDIVSIWRQAPLDPTFIVYDDGLVIYRADPFLSTKSYFVYLDSQSLLEFKSKLDREAVLTLNQDYYIEKCGDAANCMTNRFYFFGKDDLKEINVESREPYSFDKQNRPHFDQSFWLNMGYQALPKGIKQAYEAAKKFAPKTRQEWKPEQIEVLFKGESKDLPNGWDEFPRFRRSNKWTSHYYDYSIYMPYGKLNEVMKVCESDTKLGIRRIFQIRDIYPNEIMWNKYWGESN